MFLLFDSWNSFCAVRSTYILRYRFHLASRLFFQIPTNPFLFRLFLSSSLYPRHRCSGISIAVDFCQLDDGKCTFHTNKLYISLQSSKYVITVYLSWARELDIGHDYKTNKKKFINKIHLFHIHAVMSDACTLYKELVCVCTMCASNAFFDDFRIVLNSRLVRPWIQFLY